MYLTGKVVILTLKLQNFANKPSKKPFGSCPFLINFHWSRFLLLQMWSF